MFRIAKTVRTADKVTSESYALASIEGTKAEMGFWLALMVKQWVATNNYIVVTHNDSASLYRKTDDFPFLTLTVVDVNADQERMAGI